ncbi:uncharacterized protein LOC127731919 [Mytilus californianus]|uniref:uncharacterized protein LOC127731919 n=1 Tax=Mytilus californianus TaxID=6549 RepID=UPI002248388D|nr:uncharacterized protein LOC127731919 [Mytilus californianus]
MSPAVHVFICRLMLQFHNEKSNNLIKKQQNPKVKAQRTLPSSDVCQLIRSHCFHPGAVYIVQKDTCQTGTDGIDEKIGSTDVEENYEEGIIQNEVTTDNTTEDIEEQTSDGNDNGTKDLTNSENTMVKRNYELRKKPPKKRRKSFWYEYDQKKIAKRLPCYVSVNH